MMSVRPKSKHRLPQPPRSNNRTVGAITVKRQQSQLQQRKRHQEQHEDQQSQPTMDRPKSRQLTVDCVATGEALPPLRSSSRPVLDAEMYLQRRVTEIVHQIRNSSSAPHFDRHVVEIDELLRCDAPLGFTPSMVLSGVPAILEMLSDAFGNGYLTRPTDAMGDTMRALTPVRRSPRLTPQPPRSGTEAHANKLSIFSPRKGKTQKGRNPSVRSMYSRMDSALATHTGTDEEEEVLEFLPPLVRRPPGVAPQTQTSKCMSLTSGAADVETAAKRKAQSGQSSPMSRRRQQPSQAQQQHQQQQQQLLLKDVSGAQQPLQLPRQDQQQQQQQHQMQQQLHVCNSHTLVDNNEVPPHVPILRDIPSALQALLYHCALPLVCLTTEDQRMRQPAVRALASAMASMLRIAPDEVMEPSFVQKEWSNGITSTPGNSKQENRELKREENGSSNSPSRKSSSETSKHENVDAVNAQVSDASPTIVAVVEVRCIEQQNGQEQGKTTNLKMTHGDEQHRREMAFRIRQAALVSLHTLLSLIEEEEKTDLNQHFTARDQKRYEATPDLALLLKCDKGNMYHSFHDSHRSVLQRTVPLSVRNGAVAVDVLAPLLERWTTLLRRYAGSNALLDSVGQSATFKDPPPVLKPRTRSKSKGEEQGEEMNADGHTATDATGYGTQREKTRINHADAEEIQEILRICLQLSTFSHHARCLVQPILCDNSVYGLRGSHDCSGEDVMSLPVLLCYTMARCVEGDRRLALCVECLWNLLEKVPEETVSTIMQHETIHKEGNSYSQSHHYPYNVDAHQGKNPDTQAASTKDKGKTSNSTTTRSLSSLSASECLLHCFMQVLLAGHRHQQRELRNDMLTVLLLMLRHDTTAILLKRNKEVVLCHPCLNNARGNEAEVAADSSSHPLPMPSQTLDALSAIAITVFDMVCGPELQLASSTARVTQRRPELFLRHHTVLSPTTRVENLQFKLLGWRFLETIHNWHAARLAHNEQPLSENHNDTDASAASAKPEGFVFDPCQYGFVEVLLRYVDTTCADALVMSWTREELLTLQGEAWRVLLALMESAVARHAHVKENQKRRKHQQRLEEGHTNGDEDEEIDGVQVFHPSGKHNQATGMPTTVSRTQRDLDSEPMHQSNLGHSQEVPLDERPGSAPLPILVEADTVFVAAGGISCALRYIREASPDAEEMICLALRVLSVLSRRVQHRGEFLRASASAASRNSIATTMTQSFQASGGEGLPPLIENHVANTQEPALLTIVLQMMERYVRDSSKEAIAASSSSPAQAASVTSAVKSSSTGAKGSRGGLTSLPRSVVTSGQSRDNKSSAQSNRRKEKGLQSDALPIKRESHVVFSAQARDVLTHCLSLLYNVAEGAMDQSLEEVIATRQSFHDMGGIELLLSLIRYALPSLSLPSANRMTPRQIDTERDTSELLCAALSCVRAFVITSETARQHLVLEDGVHVLLTVIETFACVPWERCYQEDVTACSSALSALLAILSDLLATSEAAREEFLAWSQPRRMCDRNLPKGSHGNDEYQSINATQLLLSLWHDDDDYVRPSFEDDFDCDNAYSGEDIGRTNTNDATLKGSMSPVVVAARRESPTIRPPGRGKDPNVCDEAENSGTDEARQDAPRGVEEEGAERTIPLLRADRWGLAAIGTMGGNGRTELKMELHRRFQELSQREEEDIHPHEVGVAVKPDMDTKDSPESGVSGSLVERPLSPPSRRARRRLAAVLCDAIGLHARLYACLAAVGLDRLAHVRASALERVKLLRLAALPAACRDEVWAAMAEAMDLSGHAWVVPAQAIPAEAENGSQAACRQVERIRPTVPDAERLVRVLADVDARALELQRLAEASLRMHAAHMDEDARRFLLARMRRGDDNAEMAALIESARGGWQGSGRAMLSTVGFASTRGGRHAGTATWSAVDCVMREVRQGISGETRGSMQSLEQVKDKSSPLILSDMGIMQEQSTQGKKLNGEETERGEGDSCRPPFSGGGYLGSVKTVPLPKLTVLERKRRRDLMIRSSRQSVDRRPITPIPGSRLIEE